MSAAAADNVSQPSHEPKQTTDEPDQPAQPQAAADDQPRNGSTPEASQNLEISVPQTPQTYLTFLLVSGRKRTMSFDPATTIGRVKELVWNAWPSEWQDERPPAPAYFRILHLGKILQDEDSLNKLSFPTSLPSLQPPPRSPPPPPKSVDQPTPTSDPTGTAATEPSAAAAPSAITEPLASAVASSGSAPQAQHAPVHVPQATIVHLSIRPYAPPTEDDLKKDKRKSRIGLWGLGASGNNAGATDGAGVAPVSAAAVENGDHGAGCCGCVIC